LCTEELNLLPIEKLLDLEIEVSTNTGLIEKGKISEKINRHIKELKNLKYVKSLLKNDKKVYGWIVTRIGLEIVLANKVDFHN